MKTKSVKKIETLKKSVLNAKSANEIKGGGHELTHVVQQENGPAK